MEIMKFKSFDSYLSDKKKRLILNSTEGRGTTSVLQTVCAGLVRFKFGQFTVLHGPYGTILDGSNSEKSNSSHRWHPGGGPLRVGTVRSGLIHFFYKFKKL
jgi:hypothetical protein